MDWILDKKQIKENKDLIKYRRKNPITYSKQTLRYCLDCKKVWEIGTAGTVLFYSHLPTYGLPRRKCKACNNFSIVSYRSRKGEGNDNV